MFPTKYLALAGIASGTAKYSSFWGWQFDQDFEDPKDPKLPLTLYQYENRTDYSCGAYEVEKAGIVAATGEYKGIPIGYVGGQCGFVMNTKDCEPNSSFNF